MQNNVYEFKRKKANSKNKGVDSKRCIAPDQPFDYDEVIAITGPEYALHSNRNGIAVLPYEELKRNFSGMLLKTVEKPTYTNVSGFKIADNYYHHIGHSWVQLLHDGWVKIGIDDFVARLFGPSDTIRLPAVGEFLMQGEAGWELNRNDQRAPMASPVSGIVFSVNDRIKTQPRIAHDDPYEEGWLFLLNPVSLKVNMKELYQEKESAQWIEMENRKLLKLMGPEYERLAATGGELIDDIYGNFPEIKWNRLVKTFLHTT
jgi:glycine cleavage system H lipoate-binding protein